MKKAFRSFKYLIIAGILCLSIFSNYSSGQAENEKRFSDFFDGMPEKNSLDPSTQNNSPETLDFFLKSEPKLKDNNIQELEIPQNPQDRLRTKEMVEVPRPLPKVELDASDFEDPFYRLRGYQKNSEKVLQPGTTIDGVQFQSYGDTNHFIEKFYKESNFSLEDVYGTIEYLEKRGGCYTCHQGIERISNNHRFACVRCHGGNRRANSLPKAHKGLVPNPSSAKNAPRFCGKCHESHVQKVERSLMSTAKRTINITRYAWGAQPLDEIPYSLKPDSEEQAYPAISNGHNVDKFLRTKCLRCHIGSESPHRPGDYRASGCSSCHMLYSNEGISLSHDRAIQKIQNKNKNQKRFTRKYAKNSFNNPRGYPLLHKFTVAIPSVQCEHCHSNSGTGQEFEGLFAKPSRPLDSPGPINEEKPVLYGKEHEFLVPDIHHEKGMHCIDCHIGDAMKPEIKPGQLESGVQIRCIDCHGTHGTLPEGLLLIESDPKTKKLIKRANLNPNLNKKVRTGDTILLNSSGLPMPHIKKTKKEWFLYSKVTGKKHKIPLLKNLKSPIAHQISKHMQEIECATCHARWTAIDWGMHIIREQDFYPDKWKNWNLSDPTLQNLLGSPTAKNFGMLDWLTAKSMPNKIEGNNINEYWWTVFSDTGWSKMIMGKNSRGKYSILKPYYQYFVTDQTGQAGLPLKRAEPPLTLDDSIGLIWTDYSPHTIRKTVRACEDCHQSSMSIGLGDPLKKSLKDAKQFFSGLKQKNRVHSDFQLNQTIDPSGNLLQTPFPPDGSRFLNKQELTMLQQSSDQYRAFRSLNLRELNFSRLLSRNEFPYDIRRRVKEKEFVQFQPSEDLFYDVEKNKFLKIDKSKDSLKSTPAFVPESLQKSGIKKNKILTTTEASQRKKEEEVIEFLYDIFEENEKTEDPLSLFNEAVPQ